GWVRLVILLCANLCSSVAPANLRSEFGFEMDANSGMASFGNFPPRSSHASLAHRMGERMSEGEMGSFRKNRVQIPRDLRFRVKLYKKRQRCLEIEVNG